MAVNVAGKVAAVNVPKIKGVKSWERERGKHGNCHEKQIDTKKDWSMSQRKPRGTGVYIKKTIKNQSFFRQTFWAFARPAANKTNLLNVKLFLLFKFSLDSKFSPIRFFLWSIHTSFIRILLLTREVVFFLVITWLVIFQYRLTIQ